MEQRRRMKQESDEGAENGKETEQARARGRQGKKDRKL